MSDAPPTPSDEVEPPADPSELTQFHFEHPWRAGAIGGIAMLGVGFARGLPWFVAVPVGIAIFLWTGLVWRRGGPGTRMRQYMLRRFPQREPARAGRRSIRAGGDGGPDQAIGSPDGSPGRSG